MAGGEHNLLMQLRDAARKRRAHPPSADAPLGLGARAADWVAANMGSWRFIMVQSAILIAWIIWNASSGRGFDPYPFILLNLLLSFQAALPAASSLPMRTRPVTPLTVSLSNLWAGVSW